MTRISIRTSDKPEICCCRCSSFKLECVCVCALIPGSLLIMTLSAPPKLLLPPHQRYAKRVNNELVYLECLLALFKLKMSNADETYCVRCFDEKKTNCCMWTRVSQRLSSICQVIKLHKDYRCKLIIHVQNNYLLGKI